MICQYKDDRHPPKTWKQFRAANPKRWLIPFLAIDCAANWAAYWLSRLAILEVLEYCGSFSLLIAVIFYFADAPERRKLRHYQAWQVINSAQGKGGNGGRIDALNELNEDHVPLIGVDVSDAFLQGVNLSHADIHRGDFHAADLRDSDFQDCNLQQCSFLNANLRRANFKNADLTDADLRESDLAGVDVAGANFEHVNLSAADLSGLVNWNQIRSLTGANIYGIQNAPDGFVAFATQKGAVSVAMPKEPNAE